MRWRVSFQCYAALVFLCIQHECRSKKKQKDAAANGRVSIETTATTATALAIFMTTLVDGAMVLWIVRVAVMVKELHTKLAKTGTVVVASLSSI